MADAANADAAADDADSAPARGTRPAVPGMPELHLAGFDGPMDLLLDLVERQRVDLGRISILQLTEQFLAGMTGWSGTCPWSAGPTGLVVATRLLLLHSRLLVPASPEAGVEAAAAVEQEVRRLDRLGVLRAAAFGLTRRPQLGRDVFARPHGRAPRVTSYMALMEACLAVLQGREGQPGAWEPAYRPAIVSLWRMVDALTRIRELMPDRPDSAELREFLPSIAAGEPDRGFKARVAVASTFAATLEMARAGEVSVEQANGKASVYVQHFRSEDRF